MRPIDIAIIVACFAAVWFTDSRAEWSEADTARQITVTASLYADWRQTSYIFDHPERFTELNPLIRNPDNYFAVCAVGHAAVAYLLPSGWIRSTWQNVTIAGQALVTARNAERGVKSRVGFFVGYTIYF